MTELRTTPAALHKAVTVPASVERAFELFTAHLTAWWPLATHSVGEEKATGVTIEGKLGGRIIESISDGSTSIWGTVTDWDPPHRAAFTWHPGNDPAHAGHVEIRFTAGGGRTRTAAGDQTTVELIHTGWERHPRGAEARKAYDTGWDFVLGRYVEHTTGA